MADRSPPDISDGMMPDEMLTVLQTEMDSIKEDQQALKDEIEKIKAQFYNLIHSCAFDDSNLSIAASLDVPEPPCSPARLRTATPGKDSSPKEAPAKGGCSYGDKLIQMMLEMPSSYLDDSEVSESPLVPSETKDEQNSPKDQQGSECQRNQAGVPERLTFENDVSFTQNSTRDRNNADNRLNSTSNLSYYPERENKPFIDSVRFNPDSVLNSTSICEGSVSKVTLNCTAADGYTSVNSPQSLMLNCTPAEPYSSVNGPQIYVNRASVLNCTPAGVNPSFISNTSAMINTASIIVNPASVLDCAPAQVTQSSFPQGEGYTVNSHRAQEENPSSSFNSTSADRHPSSGFREVLGEANPSSSCASSASGDYPPSRCRDVLGEAQPLSKSSENRYPSEANPPNYRKSKSMEHNSSSCGCCDNSRAQPSSLDSYRSHTNNPSHHSSSESDLAHPLANSTSTSGNPTSVPYHHSVNKPQNHNKLLVTMNTTPSINGPSYNSQVLHSTPAVNTGKHGHITQANLLNPMCSAIVDYSVSSSESEQSDTSSRCPQSSNEDRSDVAPYLDRHQEMMSRMKYYSDFTIDRQRQINRMRSKQDVPTPAENGSSSQDDVPNDTLCRFVEGAEERSHQVCLIGPPYSSRSGSIGSSSSGGSSTLQKTAVSQSRYSNSPSPKQNHSTSRVLKSSENTRPLHPAPVPGRRPSKASSTTSGNSTSPSSSVYAWSLQSSSNNNYTETSSHRHHRSSRHGDSKRGDKRPRSSRKRSSRHGMQEVDKHIHCRDHAIHTMLGQPCHQVVKYLPIQQFYPKDLILSNDSLYDDGYKSQTLPRSSTKKSLNHCSSNSSLEAKRNSVPDICALKSPPNSALISSGSDSLSSKYPPGRLGCIGMSTTSGSQDSQGTDSSVPLSKGGPSSSVENNENTALTDSILTDSPKSVSSSGIFAPCNSPDATVGSRISCSTIADSHHIDLRGISVIQPNATALSGLSAIQSASDISEFKVPKAPAPRKSSRRKGNRCSTPDVRTSTPKPKSYPNSVQSEQISRRKLFSSSSSTHSSYGSSSRLLDKRSVIKKFRRFSENFYKTKSGKVQIETLANL